MNPDIVAGIRRLLQDEPAQGKRLLDASAGDGHSSRLYRDGGFEVVASNYDPSEFSVEGIPCVRADLNERWPFDDAAFDVVVLQEVIEHLENVPLVFREARRLLKPGGCLIFSTPNMLTWSSRRRLYSNDLLLGKSMVVKARKP
ncbi:MAG: class I SAM-dependent methyltransferase [Verrucomicrobia bacterium]|nr:class I SAM-dependent methyltransferase [Verrucomicrobiota bacterium]